jgi:DNA-binding CsgD family transcriptional regulator
MTVPRWRADRPNPTRGRDRELAVLRDKLAVLGQGIGAVWLIEGAPGLGKSRLLEESMLAARKAGCAIGYGAAQPGDAAVPLAALMNALFSGTVPLLERRVIAEPRSASEPDYWLLQDVQALLEKTALKRPVLVCLDDLQWADNSSIAALRSLPASLASLPVGWVLAFRPVDAGSQLGRTAPDRVRGGGERSRLRALSRADTSQLVADVIGGVPDDTLLGLAQGMQGNPFYLMELLSGLRAEGLVAVDGGRAVLTEARLPLRVRDGMRRRLGRLSPTARITATVAASMGRRFTIDQLAAVLKVPAADLVDPVAELISDQLLTGTGQALAFTHDLNREAVRASQPSSAAQAVDRQVAAVLLDEGALPVEVATRLASSAVPGDEVAISTLLSAADALGATDPGQAAGLARRALDLTPNAHPLRGRLVAHTALLLHAAGRTEEAQAFADGAVRQALPADAEAEVHLSVASLFAISPEIRVRACRQALTLDGIAPSLRARLLALLFYNLVVAGRSHQALELLDQVKDAVAASQDHSAAVTLEISQAAILYPLGHFDEALAKTEAALNSDLDVSQDTMRQMASHLRCRLLAETDRFDEALAAAMAGIRFAQQARNARALQLYEGSRARQLLQLGQLTDAAAILEGRFRPEDAHLVLSVLDADAVVVLGRVALHTADQQQASLAAAVARALTTSGVPGVQRHGAWLLALQAQAAGDPRQARRWLGALGERERLTIFPLFPLDPLDDPQLVRIALASGDHELAAAATAAAHQRSAATPSAPALLASAVHAAALLTGDRDRLAEAVDLLQAGPRRLALASALEDLGVAEGRDGRTEQAISALDRALSLHAACGASWDLARVRRRLRQLGSKRRLPAQRRPAKGWAGLTDSELAVVRLVAEGLTNREVAERLYISSHTVSGHLRHAFEKLSINSRVALTRIAAGQGQ